MAAGYIYVLVNSSMPGLVKVGMTTKSASDRAEELSGVTGVPTPFIVAYEERFDDCEAAESFVHVKLAEKGVRVSQGREFFRATVSDVVKVITSINTGVSKRILDGEGGGLLPPENDEFASVHLDGAGLLHPWDDLMREAGRHHFGLGDYIKDAAEAFRLYQDAARLGSPVACERLGNMCLTGDGVREDPGRALEFYKEGAKRGNYICYAQMGFIFTLGDHPDADNVWKCYAKFMSQGEANGWNQYAGHLDRRNNEIYWALAWLSFRPDEYRGSPPIFRRYIPELLAHCCKLLDATKGPGHLDDATLRTQDIIWRVVRLLKTLDLEPGSYKIFGVDKESGYRTELVVEAKDRGNVKALGDLHGMDITAVERVPRDAAPG